MVCVLQDVWEILQSQEKAVAEKELELQTLRSRVKEMEDERVCVCVCLHMFVGSVIVLCLFYFGEDNRY
jgi:hypothetical protein